MTPATDLLRAILALGFVLGLIWLLGQVIRRYGWKWGLPTPMDIGKTKRLRLIEVLSLDGKNRLVLVKRDNVEHLLLINANHSDVIETIGNSEKDAAL